MITLGCAQRLGLQGACLPKSRPLNVVRGFAEVSSIFYPSPRPIERLFTAEIGATPIGSGVRTGAPVSQRLKEGYDRGDFVYP